ncbi:hypothetical protein BGX26_003961 [Mortierella sp. AD094]|nr:hypothetical protein BGX26_003961 [Mortierella sp. AD094]
MDNHFIRGDPIRNCLARNDIRHVLELALLNEPVFMLPKKISFIKDLDDFLEDRYSEVLKTIHDAVAIAKESSPFHTILQLTKIQCDGNTHKDATLSSSPLKLVFSRRFENTWDAPTANGLIEVEMESMEDRITHIDILQHDVEVVKRDGGIGAHRLRRVFRWTSALNGVLDIRIYVNVAATSHRSISIQKNITEAVQDAVSNSKNVSNQHKLIMELLQRYRQFHVMRHLASSSIVYPETIQLLSICNIDQETPIDLFQCVENLEKAYLSAVDAYTPKPTSPDKTSTEIIVGGGDSGLFQSSGVYLKASDQGDAGAQHSLGCMYQCGNGVNHDYFIALRWYRKAAIQGNASAQNSMGFMYGKGYGVDQDYSKALEWYLKAAHQGDASAQYSIGLMYGNGYGVVKDYSKALDWYLKAAYQGDSSAQYSIGVMYGNGYGVVQDYSKALKWYQKAADQGNASAQYSLGCMYQCGYSVVRDYSKALEWYQKAADQGDTDAQRDIDAIQKGTAPLN